MKALIPESEADKTKDVFVGLWRPPLSQVMKSVKIIPNLLGGCRHCGFLNEAGEIKGFFQTEQQVKEAWLYGDWDSALYQRIIE